MPMVNEAFYTLMEVSASFSSAQHILVCLAAGQDVLMNFMWQGVGTAEDIDKGMKLGTNHPMGPLQLADFIGECCICCLDFVH